MAAPQLQGPLATPFGIGDRVDDQHRQNGRTRQAAYPLLLTLVISVVWIAVVGLSWVPEPVLTLVFAGLVYAGLSIVLSAILSPILEGEPNESERAQADDQRPMQAHDALPECSVGSDWVILTAWTTPAVTHGIHHAVIMLVARGPDHRVR